MRELTFVFPLLIGLLFMTGRGIVFGVEGSEPATFMFPENQIAGWVFIGFSMIWLFPPWVVGRIIRAVKRLFKSQQYARKKYLERIAKQTGEK